MARYFKIPFASTGDKVVIPDATQPDGSVSFTQGFGFDYERLNTDPAYKPVPREGTNGILHDVTEAIGVIQRQGAADWTIDAQPYPINAQVYHNGKQWSALRANSVEPAEGEDWTELVGKQYIDANLPDLAGYLQPSMTGSATLNGTTDNTVQLTNIATTLGLGVGDVIRIQYSGYNKLHTVESITDGNSIIVNNEHAGGRGNGSLKLVNQTTTTTITRITKWYNAPVGLGQSWIGVKASRAWGTVYTNTTGRAIAVQVCAQDGGGGNLSIELYVNGLSLSKSYAGVNYALPAFAIVPANETYEVRRLDTNDTIISWVELR